VRQKKSPVEGAPEGAPSVFSGKWENLSQGCGNDEEKGKGEDGNEEEWKEEKYVEAEK
jgi:hypothetical protein